MNSFALFKKELRSYMGSPFIYVIAAIFLCLCGYYFYTDLIFFVQFGFGLNIMENFWQLLFIDLRLVMLLTVPLLTMRLLAEEKKLGTLELLVTYPLRDGEIFLGKFAACAVVTTLLLLCTLLYPLLVYRIQPFDYLPVIAGYGGLFLLALSFIACGIFVSSLTENQVLAGMVTVGVLLFFWILSWNEGATGPELLRILLRFSMFDHFQGFSRGVIDSQDVAYFVFFVIFFSSLTLRSMETRKWRGRR